MASDKQANKPTHITRGDVFDDLGLSPQESLEAKIKADLWSNLLRYIERRGMDQAALAHALNIHQPDVSNLLRGKLSRFSTAKLISFAVRLDLEVQVKLIVPKARKQAGRVPSSRTRLSA